MLFAHSQLESTILITDQSPKDFLHRCVYKIICRNHNVLADALCERQSVPKFSAGTEKSPITMSHTTCSNLQECLIVRAKGSIGSVRSYQVADVVMCMVIQSLSSQSKYLKLNPGTAWKPVKVFDYCTNARMFRSLVFCTH